MTDTVSASSNQQVWIINALKAIFIISVLIIHCSSYIGPNIKNWIVFRFFIELAVPFFMILSGFTFALSMKKHEKITEWYRKNVFLPKLVRFTLPIIVTIIVFTIIKVLEKSGIKAIVKTIGTFDIGPGGYYFALMLELLAAFPLIYYCIHKWKHWGMFLLIIINLGVEVLATFTDMNVMLYSREILRFIGFCGFGVWILDIKDIENRSIMVFGCITSMILGGIWIFMTRYMEYASVIFTKNITYALPVLFWCGPLLLMTISFFQNLYPGNGVIRESANVIGNASFHILAVQMIWFTFVDKIFDVIKVQEIVASLISIVISMLVGILFYHWDRKFQNIIKKVYTGY